MITGGLVGSSLSVHHLRLSRPSDSMLSSLLHRGVLVRRRNIRRGGGDGSFRCGIPARVDSGCLEPLTNGCSPGLVVGLVSSDGEDKERDRVDKC
jgi:hypothetical protein